MNSQYSADAIDNIQTKVDLLKYCHDHCIKVRHYTLKVNLYNLSLLGLFFDGCRRKM